MKLDNIYRAEAILDEYKELRILRTQLRTNDHIDHITLGSYNYHCPTVINHCLIGDNMIRQFLLDEVEKKIKNYERRIKRL